MEVGCATRTNMDGAYDAPYLLLFLSRIGISQTQVRYSALIFT
jgi:hypothetical protein